MAVIKERREDRPDPCPRVFILARGDAGKQESIEPLSWSNSGCVQVPALMELFPMGETQVNRV